MVTCIILYIQVGFQSSNVVIVIIQKPAVVGIEIVCSKLVGNKLFPYSFLYIYRLCIFMRLLQLVYKIVICTRNSYFVF